MKLVMCVTLPFDYSEEMTGKWSCATFLFITVLNRKMIGFNLIIRGK